MRPFIEQERLLLLHIVELAPEGGSDVFRAQLSVADHAGWWFEGSQSFDIAVPDGGPLDPTPADMSDGRRIGPGCFVYLPGRPHTLENSVGTLDLWIIDGTIAALEYAWWTELMPDCLPELGQLSMSYPQSKIGDQ